MSDLYPNPEWATAAAAGDLTSPTDEKRAKGWLFLDEPPYQTFNAMFNAWGEWANNHASYGAHYVDMLALARFMGEGEVGELMPAYSGVAPTFGPPFSALDEVSLGATAQTIRALAIGGLYVDPAATRDDSADSVLWGAAVVDRSTTDTVEILEHLAGSILATLTFSNTVTSITNVATNGRYVAVVHDDFVELFDCADPRSPSSVMDYDHGAALAAVAIDQDRLYIAGASGTGSATVRSFPLDGTATPLVSYNHGATVNGLAVDGSSVYIGGNAGTGSAIVRKLTRDLVAVWSNPSAAVVANASHFTTDGTELFSGGEVIELGAGGVAGSLGAGTPTGTGLGPEFAFFVGGDEALFTRRGAQYAAAANAIDVGGTARVIASWGDRVWVGHDDAGTGNVLTILAMPSARPRRFRRAAESDTFIPYARAVYPV